MLACERTSQLNMSVIGVDKYNYMQRASLKGSQSSRQSLQRNALEIDLCLHVRKIPQVVEPLRASAALLLAKPGRHARMPGKLKVH